MIRTPAALVFLIAGAGASQAAENCDVPAFKVVQDVAMTGYMTVKAGKSCGIGVGHSLGGSTGVEVTRRPAHGSVQSRGLIIVYTARAGFTGKDSFGYVRHGRDESNGSPARYPVNIQVTVVP